jgi:hypothetical protein
MCAVNQLKPKKLNLKKIASRTVFKTNNGVNIRDIMRLVKDQPIQNLPMVTRSFLAQEKTVKLRQGTQAFIKILMHSRKCGSCKNIKCIKMKMIHDHFNKCSKNGQNCLVCGQLIALLTPFLKQYQRRA